MTSFELTIVTPEGCKFSGQAERLTLRTTEGEVTICGRHINYAAAIGMGPAVVVTAEGEKRAACMGGVVSMTNNVARVVATTFEWAEDLDLERAKNALARAEAKLSEKLSDEEKILYESARRRALVRIGCASR